MKYISGIHALNTPCNLKTMGDWHVSAIQWNNPCMYDTEESIFKDFGIEYNKKIPEHTETYPVANHIRAFLDLMDHGQFRYAQGANRDFIANKRYHKIIFSKVLLLKNNVNWPEIKDFMNNEFKMDWIRFLGEKITFPKMLDTSWYEEHKKLMDNFLSYLFYKSNQFVLRDSTALQYCYGLTRYSDEIFLNSLKDDSKVLHSIVESFCHENKISYLIETESLKKVRFHLYYSDQLHPIKIELKQCLNTKEIVTLEHYKVYTINFLFDQKIKQFVHYKWIRDLYDIVYICKNYWDVLDGVQIRAMQDYFFYFEYDFFEMIFATQVDELINSKQLKKEFKKLWKKIGF